jgi:NADH-quinone oxidoreductase subunit H
VIASSAFAAVHVIPDPPLAWWPFIISTVVKMIVVFTVYMVGVAMLTLAERKISAWIQGRLGPNRVGGKLGLLQPAADGVKNIMKEETLPGHVNKPIFMLAPMLAFIPALMAAAVIPFGATWDSRWGRIPMVIADLPVGFLFILAITSLGVYGIVLAGWASNNKYALLGGLRSSAQMISYEIAMGMSLIPVLLLAGNVTLNEIVDQQANMYTWNVLTLTISFFIFMVAAFAETNRLPFDLPEAESELIAGYHTEYSAMKFSMFPISEYANMATSSALMATLFFGGWNIPFMTQDNSGGVGLLLVLLSILIFAVKTGFFIFVFIWIRWTLPRFRYDQLMSLGWKTMLPMALAYIVIIAATILALDYFGSTQPWLQRTSAWYGVVMLGVNIVLAFIVFFILDRGRIISPAYGRATPQQIARLRAVTAARSHLSPQSGD